MAASPDFEPYGGDTREAAALIEEGKYEEGLSRLMSMMNSWFLNPGIHLLVSRAHLKMENEENARVELALAKLFLKGILSTGDGSEEHPYLVMRVADEYDILRFFEKKLRIQCLIEEGGKNFDRLECEDGSHIWFDVTLLRSRHRRGARARRNGECGRC